MMKLFYNSLLPLRLHVITMAACLAAPCLVGALRATETQSEGKSEKARDRLWRSQPPEDCPVEPSVALPGVAFTGRHVAYTNADTWYPSWASDGHLYSPFTDGRVGDMAASSHGAKATTGQAKIEGDDPLDLKIMPLGITLGPATPYGGRYPSASLMHDGVWYYGTYCLDLEDIPGYTKKWGGHSIGLPDVSERIRAIDSGQAGRHDVVLSYNWPRLGPFVGFRHSTDLGATWTDGPHTPQNPLFAEPATRGGKVKIGAPHFVDFGKNMEHSPDGNAYLVAHGASDPDPMPRPANLSWISGDEIYLLRVKPSVENINDSSKYEFFAGLDGAGNGVWTSDFARIKPLFAWNNRCGVVTMTYNAPLKKYLMVITDGWPTTRETNTYVLESDHVTGPWKLVTFLREFGVAAYFVNIPSKFISSDGRTGWLCYSTNCGSGWLCHTLKVDPPGARYGMSLQEFRLLDATELKR